MQIKIILPNGKEVQAEITEQEAKKLDNPLPKTWGEVGKCCLNIEEKYFALKKLEILRDIYNDGWKADWEDGTMKYVVFFYNGKIDETSNINTQLFLHFKTPELRGEFLKNFRGLIEEARDLL